MSKKNSNVILRNCFKDFPVLAQNYLKFKSKLDKLKADSFLIAISGGPDSLALTAFAKAYSYGKDVKISFVLVNHNIRNNSTSEALKVKKLLKKHKINIYILSNKKKITSNIQSQARKIRYDILKNFCIKKNINIILTAHNLEDQVETFLIRLSRGSGLAGLSSMKPLSKIDNKIKLYRPLLDTQKKVLIDVSKTVFGKFFKDPSNKDTKYLRTKIRNLQKPLSKSGINYSQIFKSINNLASSNATLDEYYNKTTKDIIIKNRDEISLSFKKFKTFNDEIKLRLINDSIKKLKKNYYNPRSKKVLNLIKNLSNRNFKGATLGGCRFFIRRGKLCLKDEKSHNY